jgi:hypothetical protein
MLNSTDDLIATAFTACERDDRRALATWWQNLCDNPVAGSPETIWVAGWERHPGHGRPDDADYEEGHCELHVPDVGSRPGYDDSLVIRGWDEGCISVYVERTGELVWLDGELHDRAVFLLQRARRLDNAQRN